ncbi:Com family DNA-binding transcriptional regulator [Pantoea sp. Tr-811]|uniref:Com family DNA-binding transcriptional regulator n=1 Tax=Pantoea sp. Tr-811 TaxID=2608361 RepID=UPI00141E3756|nr:Com family DNA-binding transcriptional regulator [Pantoea sp. Tr-811]
MLRDIRCGKCNRLLARAAGVNQLQIKCSRCRTMNQVTATDRYQSLIVAGEKSSQA